MTKLKIINPKYMVFEVESSRGGTHDVIYDRKNHKWSCTCEDYFYRKRMCKHCKQAIDYTIKTAFEMTKYAMEIENTNEAYIGNTINPQEIIRGTI